MIGGLKKLGFGFLELGSTNYQKNLAESVDENNKIDFKHNTTEYHKDVNNFGVLYLINQIVSFKKRLLRQNPLDRNLGYPIGVNITPSRDTKTYAPYLSAEDFLILAQEISDKTDFVVLNL